ncbi:MAG: DUF6356 family protein [Pseudomonadota bacterium]
MRHFRHAFTQHPSSVGESYFQHMRAAFGFGWSMLFGGFACLIHGIFPFLCAKTGSRCIGRLHHRMVIHRDRRPAGVDGRPVMNGSANSHV